MTLHIPDEIASRLAEGGNLPRRALEALAVEELRAERITEPQLGEMLGLSRIQIDEFLKSHGVYEEYTLEGFEEERRTLKELGL